MLNNNNEASVQLKAVFEDLPGAVLLADDQGRYVEANQAAVAMLGYEKHELLALSIFDIIARADSPNAESLWNKFQIEKLQDGEIALKRKDGSVIICEYEAKANILPGLNLALLKDISHQKELMEKLVESESRFRNAFEYSPTGMAIVNPDGSYRHVNETLCNMLGYSKEELKNLSFQNVTYKEDVQKDMVMMADLASGKIHHARRNKRYYHRSGSVILASLHISTIRDSDDQLLYFIIHIENITEKNSLQQMVVTEQKKFSEMFNEAPVSMSILKGPEHVFEKANELYCALCGRSDIIGKTVREVFPEAEGQGIFEIMDNVYQTGLTYSTNEHLVRLHIDGSGKLNDIYLNFMFQPYRNKDGNVEGIFFFGVDVTEQVIARKRVEESEARYRQIVEIAQEGIWLFNENDVTVFLNSKMAEILEYQMDEVLGKDLCHFTHEEMKAVATSVVLRQRQFSKNTVELRFLSKWGRDIWASLSTSSIVDKQGDYKGYLAMVTDITEKKRIDDELARLSLIARNTMDAVSMTDDKGRILWVNESFIRMSGYTLKEVYEKKPEELFYGDLTDKATRLYIEEKLARREGYRCEIRKYRKSGTPFWVKTQAQPLFAETERLSHYFVIETDITERKEAFEKLAATEQEVRSFAMQLNNLLESERLRIAREIHDELGQQLTGIKMLLATLAATETGAGSHKIINDMRQSVDSARASIRNLATELRPGILDTLGLIPSIEWLVKGFEKKSGIKCSLNVRAVDQRFEEKISITFFRICQEALTNIMKHSGATNVSIQLLQNGQRLSLQIKDNGKGISDEAFRNPFSMGLIGMRERAKLIGAKFSIESDEKSGTTLYLIH